MGASPSTGGESVGKCRDWIPSLLGLWHGTAPCYIVTQTVQYAALFFSVVHFTQVRSTMAQYNQKLGLLNACLALQTNAHAWVSHENKADGSANGQTH